uniref:RNA1 polyprotein n=1 Tax=Broad bean wilt virus 2 TaxID=76875 RepID=J7I6C8_BBWV2|nr:precursor polyprotein [Broad bean wilt virus 2]
MDFSMMQMAVGFLKTSMGLQSIKDIVGKACVAEKDKTLLHIHLCFFHANEMARDFNEGMDVGQIQSSAAIKYRAAVLKRHVVMNVETGRYDRARMMQYNNETCVNWFSCEIVEEKAKKVLDEEEAQENNIVDNFLKNCAISEEVGQISEEGVERYAFGQGLYEYATRISDAIVAVISGSIKKSIDDFLDKVYAVMAQVFAAWMPRIRAAFQWFENIKEVIKRWANSMHEKINFILVGMEDCLYMGAGLVAATCIVTLLEKFMIAIGILTKPCGAATLFLTTAMAAISATYVCGKALEKSAMLTNLLLFVTTNCRVVLDTLFNHELGRQEQEMSQNDEKAPTGFGQFGVSTMLQDVANLVSTWSTSSVTEIGKTFGAISQIKNGILALRDMVYFVFEKLSELAHRVLGFESQVLADLSVLLGENVADWLCECDCMVAYMLEFNSRNREIFDRLSQLIEKGRMIRTGVLRSSHRGSSQVMSLVTKALEKLIELHNSVVMAGSNTTRKSPFMVFFTGASGTGKTSVVQRVAINWLQEEQLGTSEIYARNGQDPFWSGYKRHAVVTYDDFGAVPGTTSNEAEIINVISRNPYATVMAGLAEKGMYFDSRLVLASSNFLAANPESGVHDSEAYERRRHAVVRVSLKPGVPYNANDPCANQTYTLLESKTPFNEIQVFETYAELWSFLYTRFKEHEEQEELYLKSLPILDSDKKEALEGLVGLTVIATSFAPKAVMQFGAEKFPGYHFLISDGEYCYFWHGDGSVEFVSVERMKLGKQDIIQLKQQGLSTAMMYKDLAKAFPTLNSLAVLYAKNIVVKRWIGADLEPTKSCEDVYMREQIGNLPKWQRAYLHVLSKYLTVQSPRGWFMECLEEAKRNLRATYLWEYKQWPLPLKLALGSLIAIMAGGAIWYSLQSLWCVSGDASFIAGAATVFSVSSFAGQSDVPNRDNSERSFRNRKIRARTWQGQSSCFGDSALWIAETCMATLTFSNVRTQVCLAPGRGFFGVNHCLAAIPAGVMVKLDSSIGITYFVWEKEKLTQFEGNEIALYMTSTMPKTVDSLLSRIHFDAETLPKTFNAVFFSYKYDPVIQQMVPELGSVTCKIHNKAFTLAHGEYRREIPQSLTYEASTVAGDCGSLILAEIEGKFKLVGMHVAFNGKEGSASFMPYHALLDQKVGQGDFVLKYQEWAEPKILGPGCRAMGLIDPEHALAASGKTTFVETPEDWHLNYPCDKLPSVLARGDPRLAGTVHADYDPFAAGMSKYAKEAGPFDASSLKQVCLGITEVWEDASADFPMDEVDLDTAINGLENVEFFDALVLGTSEGFPYRLDRGPGEKGKSRYVSGESGNFKITDEGVLSDINWFEETSKTQVPDLYCIECVKDERLPIRKVLHEPKSRLFTVLPMSYNIAIRKKFLNFVRFFMKRRDVLPAQVGVNPYSREWTRIANKLLSKGNNILCCDYSRFDGFLPKCIMNEIGDMIARVMRANDESKTQIKNLMLACTSRYAMCNRILYRVENGIPSGFPLTVIVNSILNEILVKYAYWHCFVDNPIVQSNFDAHVSMVVYGDDNLISVSDAISSKFDGNFLVKFMEGLGIKVTDGIDKTKIGIEFRRLENCDFLKRSFKLNPDGTWRSPMSKESLWPQLHYVKAKKLEMAEAYINNCNNILRELWLHDVIEAKEFRNRVLRNLKWIGHEQLLNMQQLAVFHSEQMNGISDFLSTCVTVDSISLMDPLVPGLLPVKTCEVIPRIFVAAEKHFEGNFEDFFTVSITTSRKFKEDKGFVLLFPYGAGRGGLPTTQFMKENVVRKGCSIQKKFRQAYERGEKILFISQSSVVPAYVFAVMLLHSIGAISRLTSNKALTQAMQTCKKLEYLPKEYEDFF